MVFLCWMVLGRWYRVYLLEPDQTRKQLGTRLVHNCVMMTKSSKLSQSYDCFISSDVENREVGLVGRELVLRDI